MMVTLRVQAILSRMRHHETGFRCTTWMVFDDALRISAIAEPTTSRGTQLASWTVAIRVLPTNQSRDRVQLVNLEGT